MNHILVVYGTIEGQTKKIAEFIGKELEAGGNRVTLLNAREVPQDFKIAGYDGVIAGGPLHISHYPRDLQRFLKRNSDLLYTVPNAFFTVCLGVLEGEVTKNDLKKIEGKFFVDCKWYPTMHTTFAGALKYSKYNWLTRFFIKRIAGKAGGNTDTSKDYEYTSWPEVTAFVQNFSKYLHRVDSVPTIQPSLSRRV